MADAIVEYGGAAVPYDQALEIAEYQVVTVSVRATRVAAIERKMLPEPPLRREAESEPRPTAAATHDLEAFALALPELLRLERYESRAFARRRRAMRMLGRRILETALGTDEKSRGRYECVS